MYLYIYIDVLTLPGLLVYSYEANGGPSLTTLETRLELSPSDVRNIYQCIHLFIHIYMCSRCRGCSSTHTLTL